MSKRKIILIIFLIFLPIGVIILAFCSHSGPRPYDARIEGAMNQIRTTAEILKKENGNYKNLSCRETEHDLDSLCEGIRDSGGRKPSDSSPGVEIYVSGDGDSYCAEVLLPKSKEYYCVDSTLQSYAYSKDPNCSANHFSCD